MNKKIKQCFTTTYKNSVYDLCLSQNKDSLVFVLFLSYKEHSGVTIVKSSG